MILSSDYLIKIMRSTPEQEDTKVALANSRYAPLSPLADHVSRSESVEGLRRVADNLLRQRYEPIEGEEGSESHGCAGHIEYAGPAWRGVSSDSARTGAPEGLLKGCPCEMSTSCVPSLFALLQCPI